MNIQAIASDIASRIPEMSRDNVINNTRCIETILVEELEKHDHLILVQWKHRDELLQAENAQLAAKLKVIEGTPFEVERKTLVEFLQTNYPELTSVDAWPIERAIFKIRHLFRENNQLSAKCAEMGKCLDECRCMVRNEISCCDFSGRSANAWPDLLTGCVSGGGIEHALSSDCGKGWLSPEKGGILTKALERIRDYPVHSEPTGSAYEMQDIASKTLEEIKQ